MHWNGVGVGGDEVKADVRGGGGGDDDANDDKNDVDD